MSSETYTRFTLSFRLFPLRNSDKSYGFPKCTELSGAVTTERRKKTSISNPGSGWRRIVICSSSTCSTSSSNLFGLLYLYFHHGKEVILCKFFNPLFCTLLCC